jgi:predicted hydrocarbon binding protein
MWGSVYDRAFPFARQYAHDRIAPGAGHHNQYLTDMRHTVKQLKNRTPQGRLNFLVIRQGHFIGDRKTANSVAEMIEKAPKNWAILEFRNDLGQRICVTREFMEEGDWTADEVIQDWLEYTSQAELEEPIKAMGKEFGETLEW